MTRTLQQDSAPTQWIAPAILVSCTAVSILSTDLYVPSLPHLESLLNTDESTVKLTMSLNLFAYAIAHLAHGPIADRFGRKRLLTVALCGFLVATIGCALALNISQLIAGRFAQGLFSSVPSVVVVLMIRELFKGDRAVGIMAIHGMAVGFFPAVGPLIGGYIFLAAGWRMNFFVLAALAAVVLIAVIRHLPETGTRVTTALEPKRIATGYFSLLRERGYLRYLIPLTAIFGGFFAFVTDGTFVLIGQLDVPTQYYGFAYGALILCYILGSLTANRLAERVSADRLVQAAMFYTLLGSLVLFVPVLQGKQDLIIIMIGMGMFFVGLGLILASGPICLLDAADADRQGPASALMGSLQMGAASLAALAVGVLHNETALPMTAVILSCSVIAVLGYVGLKPRHAA